MKSFSNITKQVGQAYHDMWCVWKWWFNYPFMNIRQKKINTVLDKIPQRTRLDTDCYDNFEDEIRNAKFVVVSEQELDFMHKGLIKSYAKPYPVEFKLFVWSNTSTAQQMASLQRQTAAIKQMTADVQKAMNDINKVAKDINIGVLTPTKRKPFIDLRNATGKYTRNSKDLGNEPLFKPVSRELGKQPLFKPIKLKPLLPKRKK